MQCKKCNTTNDDGSRFCKACGQKLETDASAAGTGSHIKVGELLYAAYKYRETGKLEDAMLACQGALALDDKNASAHSLLASLYVLRGDIDSAILEYEKTVALNPENAADRRKLDDLKSGTLTPPKKTAFGLLEQLKPYIPPVAAVAVLCIVLALGISMVRTPANRPATNASASTPQNAVPFETPPVQPYAQQSPQGQYAAPEATSSQTTAQTTPQSQTTTQVQQSTATPTDNSKPASPPRRGVPPVPIPKLTVQAQSSVERPSESTSPANVRRSTAYKEPPVIVPVMDTPAQPAQSAPSPQSTGSITITRPTTRSSKSSVKAPTPQSRLADPEQRARELQKLGKYEQAISAYREALGKIGDKGRVYQQVGLCYQRLGQRAMAIDSYNRAISSFKSQQAAGRDPADVQRSIRACEAGILVNQ